MERPVMDFVLGNALGAGLELPLLVTLGLLCVLLQRRYVQQRAQHRIPRATVTQALPPRPAGPHQPPLTQAA